MDRSARQFAIDIDGRTVPYRVRKSAKARKCWLKVTLEDGLIVVKPRWMAQRDIPDVLRAESDWVMRQLDRLETTAPPALPADVDSGTEVMFRGEPWVVKVTLSSPGDRYAQVKPNGGTIDVAIPFGCDAPIRAILEAWMRNQAKWLIRAEVDDLARAHRLPYNRIYVRDQKTKWGSCSSRGNLSFNWRLVMAPPFVLKYLVAHEVAHLKEFGHTQRFWEVLAEMCPDCEDAKTWLREHGHSLRF